MEIDSSENLSYSNYIVIRRRDNLFRYAWINRKNLTLRSFIREIAQQIGTNDNGDFDLTDALSALNLDLPLHPTTKNDVENLIFIAFGNVGAGRLMFLRFSQIVNQ
jgi:hypothetical protein